MSIDQVGSSREPSAAEFLCHAQHSEVAHLDVRPTRDLSSRQSQFPRFDKSIRSSHARRAIVCDRRRHCCRRTRDRNDDRWHVIAQSLLLCPRDLHSRHAGNVSIESINRETHKIRCH
jgi:hypothetical protein